MPSSSKSKPRVEARTTGTQAAPAKTAQPKPPARGRPRAFRSEDALDRVLATFWDRGYGGTSVDDLVRATSLNKPSLYGAFGNKEALYDAAVDHYVATVGSGFLRPLHERDSLERGLEGFYDEVIDTVTGRHGPLGCIVACTLPAEAGTSPAAREKLRQVLQQLDAAVTAALAAAVARGELPKGADIPAVAQVVTSGMLSISIRARSGASRRELKKLARTFVTLVTRS